MNLFILIRKSVFDFRHEMKIFDQSYDFPLGDDFQT